MVAAAVADSRNEARLMAGRPQKAIGTHGGHRSIAAAKVQPRPEGFLAPAVPAGLLKRSRDEWESVWVGERGMHLHPENHLALMENWVLMFDERIRAWKTFRKNRYTKGSTGQIKLSDAWKQIQALDRLIAKAEEELGISPGGRIRHRLPPLINVDEEIAELNRQMSEPDEPMGPRVLEDWKAI